MPVRGNDLSGFTGLAGGNRLHTCIFESLGHYVFRWTATVWPRESSYDVAYFHCLNNNDG